MSLKTDKTAFKKRLLCFCVALVCLITAVVPCVSAEESLDEMQNRYEELEKDIEKNEQALAQVQQDIKTNEKKAENISSQIEKIEEQIDLLDESIDILNGDISDLQSSIDVTTNDIESINSQISEIELQIEQTDALMAQTREMLLARIRENYMAGGTGSSLEILLSSGDISSFFARKELVTSVSENDAQLVNEKKTELDTQMDSLNERENELESSKAAQNSKKSDATEKYDELKYIINELDKDSDVYKKTIKRQQAEREALEAEIDEYIRQHGSSQGDIPDEEYENDGDMMWPVKGDTRITAGYPSYSDGSPHWGIDIVKSDGNTRGQPFYAAQGGEVIIAKNDGNWNSGFGNYCVIDHGDGTQTLYAHSDNILVSVGQVVKKGEKIGIIGATGNVTGPHLHFEVRVKKADGSVSRVNPLNYVSKP